MGDWPLKPRIAPPRRAICRTHSHLGKRFPGPRGGRFSPPLPPAVRRMARIPGQPLLQPRHCSRAVPPAAWRCRGRGPPPLPGSRGRRPGTSRTGSSGPGTATSARALRANSLFTRPSADRSLDVAVSPSGRCVRTGRRAVRRGPLRASRSGGEPRGRRARHRAGARRAFSISSKTLRRPDGRSSTVSTRVVLSRERHPRCRPGCACSAISGPLCCEWRHTTAARMTAVQLPVGQEKDATVRRRGSRSKIEKNKREGGTKAGF